MVSRKPNYAAQRQAATRYADKVMNRSTSLQNAAWVDAWGLVYKAYLDGLRAAFTSSEGQK